MALHIPSQDKASKILKDKSVRGNPLTKAQRGFFGLIKSGKKPNRLNTVRNAVKQETT